MTTTESKAGMLGIQIELAALTARMYATVAGIEGMKAGNADRLQNGLPVAYDKHAFADEARILNRIAEDMRALARTLAKGDAS